MAMTNLPVLSKKKNILTRLSSGLTGIVAKGMMGFGVAAAALSSATLASLPLIGSLPEGIAAVPVSFAVGATVALAGMAIDWAAYLAQREELTIPAKIVTGNEDLDKLLGTLSNSLLEVRDMQIEIEKRVNTLAGAIYSGTAGVGSGVGVYLSWPW